MPPFNPRLEAQRAAQMNGIPLNIYNALVKQESGWNPSAVSPAGAMGYTQLMPQTAKGLGVNPADPIQNLHGGAKYLKMQYDRFHDWGLALAAYNAGAGAVAKYGGIPPYAETQNYVKSILAQAGQAGGSGVQGGSPQPSAATSNPPALSPEQQAIQSSPLHQTGAQLLQAAKPSASAINIAERLGGTAAKTMSALSSDIPLPKTVQTLPSGTKVQVDHEGPIAPGAQTVVQQAEQYLGTPYQWGGANPKTGFDCSGFVQWLYGQQGVKLGRTTYQQVNQGKAIKDETKLQPGDIVFFSQKGDVHHEGLYIGNGQFIHSPHTGDVIKISSLSEPYYRQQFLMGRRPTAK